MSFENIIVTVLGLIISGGVIAYLLAHRKNVNRLEMKDKIIGKVERFGYCTLTPKGWGFWLLKLEGEQKIIKLWPHMHKNHVEIALTKCDDSVEIEFYRNNDEYIATNFKNKFFD